MLKGNDKKRKIVVDNNMENIYNNTCSFLFSSVGRAPGC